MQKRLARQLSRYVAVGALATVGHYGTFIPLIYGAGLHPVPSALLAYLVGGTISYLLNYRLTFESDRPHAQAATSFAAVAFAGFVLTGGLMHLFVDRLGIEALPAQIVTTGIVLVWNFVGNKLWTFRERVVP